MSGWNFETIVKGGWYQRKDGVVVGPAKRNDDDALESAYSWVVGGCSYTDSGLYSISGYLQDLNLIFRVNPDGTPWVEQSLTVDTSGPDWVSAEICDDPRKEWLGPEVSKSACSGPYLVKTRCGKNARIEMDYRKFASFGIGVEWGHVDKCYRTIGTGKVNLKTGEFVADAEVSEPEPQATDDATSDDHVDEVSHPRHYKCHPSGVECIQITEHLNFCRGNAVKYIWRAGEKGNEIVDLQKARWYIDREIKRLGGE